MTYDILLFAFLFILLVILMTSFINPKYRYPFLIILSVAVVGFFGMMFKDELFTSGPNFNDLDPSKYRNVSETTDIDQLGQRIQNEKFMNTEYIDNSDVVEASISGGASTFQPIGQGVTPIHSAEMSNFSLAEPSQFPQETYLSPLSGSLNVDEMLARKQQHRANINKRAIDGAVRSTKNLFQRFFLNELDQNEKRDWWDSEAQDMETDFTPY